MQLTAEELQKNWDTIGKIVNKYISEPRRSTVIQMLEDLSEFMVVAPASGRAHYHYAFPGGYNAHVINVVKAALKTKALWEEEGAIIDFTDEELIFSALFHDLGKIGDGTKEGYLQQKDKWRQDKLKEMYIPNPELPFMLIQDRSLYILQKYGITLTENEYLGIRLHDGVYDDANKAYYISHSPDAKMRTNIVYILHQADFLAARVEYQEWVKATATAPQKVVKKNKNGKSIDVSASEGLMNMVKNL